jgi:hypothetical protein
VFFTVEAGGPANDRTVTVWVYDSAGKYYDAEYYVNLTC